MISTRESDRSFVVYLHKVIELQIGARGSTRGSETPRVRCTHLFVHTDFPVYGSTYACKCNLCVGLCAWRVCNTHVRIYECTSTHVCTLSHCIMDACTRAHKIRRRATNCTRMFLGKLHSITLCSNLCISIVETLYREVYMRSAKNT